jgi:hypothetical protein
MDEGREKSRNGTQQRRLYVLREAGWGAARWLALDPLVLACCWRREACVSGMHGRRRNREAIKLLGAG